MDIFFTRGYSMNPRRITSSPYLHMILAHSNKTLGLYSSLLFLKCMCFPEEVPVKLKHSIHLNTLNNRFSKTKIYTIHLL
jgi:hypothetical protein